MFGQVILYYFFIRFSEGVLPDVFKQFYPKICGSGLRKHQWRYSIRSKIAAVITVKILEHFS